MERLYISLNRIREIPDEIGYCQRLVELDFSSNLLEAVPVGLAMCINLNLLNLGANKIVTLPPDIFSALIQLRELQLYKNKLTVLPAEIGNLKGLSLSLFVLSLLPSPPYVFFLSTQKTLSVKQ
jgi:Leucine-rich repeat (LRR) protein